MRRILSDPLLFAIGMILLYLFLFLNYVCIIKGAC